MHNLRCILVTVWPSISKYLKRNYGRQAIHSVEHLKLLLFLEHGLETASDFRGDVNKLNKSKQASGFRHHRLIY